MSSKLIDFVHVSKTYGMQTVLDDLNLYIRENEFLTFWDRAAAEKPPHCVFSADSKRRIRER